MFLKSEALVRFPKIARRLEIENIEDTIKTIRIREVAIYSIASKIQNKITTNVSRDNAISILVSLSK